MKGGLYVCIYSGVFGERRGGVMLFRYHACCMKLVVSVTC